MPIHAITISKNGRKYEEEVEEKEEEEQQQQQHNQMFTEATSGGYSPAKLLARGMNGEVTSLTAMGPFSGLVALGGRVSVSYGFCEFDLLKVEADYYGLPALVQEIEVILVSFKRKRRRRPNPNRKKTSQSVNELHRVHERDGDLYISDED
ncbi:hypothetical protein DPMN_190140 [Dreissena polymorpha]|uniref:Uncharacterized protein n=1 Tax=Dreissena polymorpha TaxID=45954 RepID=A0A9D4DTN1_DREPO|nr:hypothetical protein DPMN_190140 [Dreissena polymorpha]